MAASTVYRWLPRDAQRRSPREPLPRMSSRVRGIYQPLEVPFHQFPIFIADAGSSEDLLQAGRRASVGVIHRLFDDGFVRGRIFLV